MAQNGFSHLSQVTHDMFGLEATRGRAQSRVRSWPIEGDRMYLKEAFSFPEHLEKLVNGSDGDPGRVIDDSIEDNENWQHIGSLE